VHDCYVILHGVSAHDDNAYKFETTMAGQQSSALAPRPQACCRRGCQDISYDLAIGLVVMLLGTVIISFFAVVGGGGGEGEDGGLFPTPDPGSSQGGTCGDGNVGNGICFDERLCCSKFGWCGSTTEYCSDSSELPSDRPPVPGPYEGGTCGGGTVGDGICSDITMCCSVLGWCDFISSAHCADWETYGSCGGGNRGNGICNEAFACCSYDGWCGFGPDYCGYRNLRARGNTN
jgi:Chitin recognition protein